MILYNTDMKIPISNILYNKKNHFLNVKKVDAKILNKLSFKNVDGFLQTTFNFDEIEGLTAKFKGLKPKKAKATKKQAKEKPVKVAVDKVTFGAKVKKKVRFVDDAGDLPVLKRKSGLQDNDNEE